MLNLQLEKYPSLILFHRNSEDLYSGESFERQAVEDWLIQRLEPAAFEIESNEQLKQIEESPVVSVAYFGENNSEFKAFISVANKHDLGIVFYYSFDPQFRTANTQIVMFKQFDMGKQVFEEDASIGINEDDLDNWVVMHR